MTNEQIADIAKNMSKGKWTLIRGYGTEIFNEDEYRIVHTDSDKESTETDEANAAAICFSVNATWGANINPEKIGDAVKFLEFIAEKLPSESERRFFGVTTYSIPFTFAEIKEIQNLLHDLKIKP